MGKVKINKDSFIKDVTKEKLTDKDLARKYNCSYITVGNLRRRLGLECNKSTRKKFNKPTKEELSNLYLKYGTDSRVAMYLDVDPGKVKKLRKEYNIEALKYGINPKIQLTHEQTEIIFGIMLGDGYCRKGKSQQFLSISIDHSLIQKEYVDYINSLFPNIEGRTYEHITSTNKKTGKRYNCYCLSWSENEAFDFFRDLFYINNKKVIPLDLLEEYYSPRAMAFHFMDDGCNSNGSVTISTCSFTDEEVNSLRAFLLKKYNIDSTKGYKNRIRICNSSRDKFIDLIEPYICESMKYKVSRKWVKKGNS